MNNSKLSLLNTLLFLFGFLFIVSCSKDEFENPEFTISTGEVSELNGNFAVASGKLRLTSGKILNHGHCWSKYQQPTIESDSKTDLGELTTTGEFFSNLTYLESGTIYYVRSYAKDRDKTTYGNEMPFMTPSVLVSEVSIIDQSPYFLDLQSRVVINDVIVASHGFCWAIHDKPDLSDSKTELGYLTSTSTFDDRIMNLQNNTTYYFRAYAVSDLTAYGPVTPIYISNIVFDENEIEQLSNTSAELTTNVIFINANVIQHGHCWSISPEPTVDDQCSQLGNMYTYGEFNTTVEGLQGNTDYYFRAYIQTNDTIVYSSEIEYHMAYPLNIAVFPGSNRIYPLTFTIDGEVYVGFGEYADSDSRRDIWKYNKDNDTWEEKALCTANLYSGKAYTVSNRGHALKLTYNNDVVGKKYDPVSNSWISLPDLSLEYVGYDIYCASINERIFLSVGDDDENILHLYELVGNTWIEKSSREYTSTSEVFGFQINGKGYWISSDYYYQTYMYEYDIDSDQWSKKGNPPEAYYQAMYYSHKGIGYSQEENIVYAYNPETDNWNSATDFSKNLKYGVAINLYNNLYLGLGDVSYGYTNEFYYYNPE